MMNVAGLDVSKGMIDCVIDGLDKPVRISNGVTGYKKLRKILNKQNINLAVLESTGGYERALFKYLWASNIPTSLLNPRQTRAFAKSLGRRAKNDTLDAEILMEYGKKLEPAPTELLSESVETLRELLARRWQLSKLLVAEKNHAKAPNVSRATLKSIKALIKPIQGQIKQIDVQMLLAINQDSILKEKSEKLSAQTGVGPVLMFTLLSYMPELGKLDKKQVSALAGVAPYDRDSGNFSGQRSISGGRVRVRCALYMATLAGIRHNAILKQFYQRLISNGKPRKVAIVACMRKFIIYLNSVLKQHPENRLES